MPRTASASAAVAVAATPTAARVPITSGATAVSGRLAEDEGAEQVERGQCDRLDEQVVQQRAGQPDDRL